jgi:CubicO group peptidase (beta-lactamase class C family)
MFEKLTKKLDSFLEIGVPFYDCIVMKDGVCVYRHANGFTDAKKQVKVTGKEKYNIYSCSKLLTCVAALQLLRSKLATKRSGVWSRHVLINDPTTGYGIFIENMLNAAQVPQPRAA